MQARGTRLKVTLMALEMKAKHKMTDARFDENMSFWYERLPKGNKCPTSFADGVGTEQDDITSFHT